MKPIRHFFLATAFIACVAGSFTIQAAPGASQLIALDRYTVLANGDLEYDLGYLLANGKFQVLASYDEGPIYDPGLYAEYLAVSGRPIIDVGSYNAYKAAGVEPTWVRSAATFYINTIAYVILSTKNGPDPNPIPVITGQPQSERVLAGETASFFVTATPTAYLSYQWLFKNKPLSGQTEPWLYVNNVSSAQAGLYSVSLSTGGKAVLSQKALLAVVTPVSIKTSPKSQTVKVGKSAIFRVALSGTAPYTYQWYFGANTIVGATSSFYTIPKVQTSDAGEYWVSAGNGLSIAYSHLALLTVTR